jgi:glycosyltransferase involved in cell wall biosynthesis
LCFTEDKEKDDKVVKQLKECESIRMIPLKLTTKENIIIMLYKAFIGLFTKYPFVVYKYKSKKMYNEIKTLLKKTQYDMLYVEHLQMYIYADKLPKEQVKVKVLDQQNCESLIVERMLANQSNSIKKVFLNVEYKKLCNYEKHAVESADKLFVLSEQDLKQMKKLTNKMKNVSVLPVSVQDRGFVMKQGIKEDKIKLLFIGTLTWEANNQGIMWFVEKVVPSLFQKNIEFELTIVGKNPTKDLVKLCGKYENINVTGYISDIDECYEQNDIMIVPLFIGGGQRVKIIEAISKGIPVISTEIGKEGLKCVDGESILIANDEDSMIGSMLKLKNREFYMNIAKNARKVYELEYSLESYYRKHKESLNQVI